VLLTGNVEGTRLLKMEAARPLEAVHLAGAWDYLLTPYRVVARAMAYEDMVPFKMTEEIRWVLLARETARREGLPMWGPALNRRVAELMHHTKGNWESAQVQATAEGLSGLDFKRRVNEIAEQRREQDMPGSASLAQARALKQTYNAEPYGLVGWVARQMTSAIAAGPPLRWAVPVVRIAANVTNEQLNWFPPTGLARVALAKWGPNEVRLGSKFSARFRNRIDGQPIQHPDDMWNLTATAVTGTILYGAAALLFFRDIDKEDPFFAVYGAGPRTKAQRDQLKAKGWFPYSIKIGKLYIGVNETDLGVLMGVLGNYCDAIRWKKLDEEDGLNRFVYSLTMFGDMLLNRRMLSGIGDILELAKDPTGEKAARFGGRVAGNYVFPNALRWVDQVFDPQVYEPNDVKGVLLSNVPLARRLNRPAINALGEPIQRGPWSRFTAPDKPDELVQVLALKNAWVPMPNFEQQVIGDRTREGRWREMEPDEYYDWITESGPRIRERLERNLGRLSVMDEERARSLVRKVTEEERERAKRRYRL